MTKRRWQPDFPFAPSRFPIFYGWVIVLVGTGAVIFSIPGQTMGFSVFTDILMEQLGLTRVQLSSAYFVGTVLSGFTLPALGRLFDRIGARRITVYAALATGGILFYLATTRRILDALTTAFPALPRVAVAFTVITVGFFLIRASAQGVLNMAGRNAIGKWFDHHRGTALAVSGIAVSFSFSFAPRALDFLIARYEWYGAWILLGIASISVMATLGWLLLRDNPEECGLLMDGENSRRKPRRHNPDAIAHRDFTRAEALRTRSFWTFNLTFAFWSLFGTAVTFHIVSIGELGGVPRGRIIGFFVPMAAISVTTNLFCGVASTHTRLKYLLVMMNAAALVGVLGTGNLDRPWGPFAFIVGHGICGGAFAALSGIVWPRFYGRAWLGAISGFSMSSMVVASGIGPLFFGLSMRLAGDYTPALWISATVPAVLLVASLKADNPQRIKPLRT